MIIEYLRYSVPTESRPDFEENYKKAIEPLLSSDYAKAIEICRCVKDPTKYILRIEWTSADDHLKKFRGSVEFRSFFAFIKPYVSMIDEMRHYEQVASG